MSEGVFEALQRWRQTEIDEGRLRPGLIKDTHLQQIVRSDRRTVGEIEPMLPRHAKPLVGGLVEALASAVTQNSAGSAEPAAPAADPEPEPEPLPGSEFLVDLGTEDFCEYLHGESEVEPGPITVTPEPGGGHRLEWAGLPERTGSTVLYRVVSGETHRAYKPEAGRLVGVTRGTMIVDTAPSAAAVRYLQVWAHIGSNDRDAAVRQPVLVAEGQLLSAVQDFVVIEDDGTVIGQWSVWPGVSRVRVLRIPLDGRSPVTNDPRHRILADQPNFGGFVDRDAQRGHRYLYRAICEIEVDGHTRLSPSAQAEVLVSAVLEPVTDLEVTTYGQDDDLRFDLRWTPPEIGAVVMYRTESAPRAGIDRELLDATALDVSGGLPASARLVHPVVVGDDGRHSMATVSWPRGWVRAYFTPVTVLDGQVQVGRTVIATRPLPALKDVRIVERCAEQVVTFPWPDGAASVSVYVSARQVPAEHAIEQRPVAEISRSQYERDGGLHLTDPLPELGCAVHVVAIAYTAGERIVGQPSTVDYPGLLRMQYSVEPRHTPAGLVLAIRLASEVELPSAPPFVVIHNQARLPLSARDGQPLEIRGGNGTQPGARNFQPGGLRRDWSQPWLVDVSDKSGFIRVFADVRPEKARTIALFDPRVEQINLNLIERLPIGDQVQ
ncbi:hypothetical protein RCF27_07065 [Rhodococcus pyridinivorans]|uniref:Uncharacterized protein n=1 Tax=Rhodococcus pyridinivorans TaxID=103816 RepID=A0A7M2XQV4_9NOCA|nr:hypothetical protein [Rhodococcus pyridinivorans]QOW00156.1 hypothetical protein INP59_07350 [Rhodococcus pyridinivorans]WMM74056.1 hypothetical protein RCF27_07065 [Rhodococcus pyridinivorans]